MHQGDGGHLFNGVDCVLAPAPVRSVQRRVGFDLPGGGKTLGGVGMVGPQRILAEAAVARTVESTAELVTYDADLSASAGTSTAMRADSLVEKSVRPTTDISPH